MAHPNRDVNGSGRILFKLYREEPDFSVTPSYGAVHPFERPIKRILGAPQEGHISEWSPNGDYIRILDHTRDSLTWYAKTDIELIEVLP